MDPPATQPQRLHPPNGHTETTVVPSQPPQHQLPIQQPQVFQLQALPPNPKIRERVVEILANTANGCLNELGYFPGMVQHLKQLEERNKTWQEENVKLYEDNQNLMKTVEEQGKRLQIVEKPDVEKVRIIRHLQAEVQTLTRQRDEALKAMEGGTFQKLKQSYNVLMANYTLAYNEVHALRRHLGMAVPPPHPQVTPVTVQGSSQHPPGYYPAGPLAAPAPQAHQASAQVIQTQIPPGAWQGGQPTPTGGPAAGSLPAQQNPRVQPRVLQNPIMQTQQAIMHSRGQVPGQSSNPPSRRSSGNGMFAQTPPISQRIPMVLAVDPNMRRTSSPNTPVPISSTMQHASNGHQVSRLSSHTASTPSPGIGSATNPIALDMDVSPATNGANHLSPPPLSASSILNQSNPASSSLQPMDTSAAPAVATILPHATYIYPSFGQPTPTIAGSPMAFVPGLPNSTHIPVETTAGQPPPAPATTTTPMTPSPVDAILPPAPAPFRPPSVPTTANPPAPAVDTPSALPPTPVSAPTGMSFYVYRPQAAPDVATAASEIPTAPPAAAATPSENPGASPAAVPSENAAAASPAPPPAPIPEPPSPPPSAVAEGNVTSTSQKRGSISIAEYDELVNEPQKRPRLQSPTSEMNMLEPGPEPSPSPSPPPPSTARASVPPAETAAAEPPQDAMEVDAQDDEEEEEEEEELGPDGLRLVKNCLPELFDESEDGTTRTCKICQYNYEQGNLPTPCPPFVDAADETLEAHAITTHAGAWEMVRKFDD